ncbi:MAG: hypothetical protein WC330_00925 [Candidatus Omnitrophota bacterium]|jgi:hypothetical protein
MALGKLKKIDLRSVWKNEASDFTKWLAEEENLSLLSEEIGLDIKLISTEVGVGTFSADILAEEENSDRKIIIENQLEITDHDHLGKLLTYASGYDAEIIINCSKEACNGNFSSNIPFETYFGWTVIIDICLPVAFYLGFDTVYLLGCDCDYRLDKAKDFSQSFFYDVSNLPKLAWEELYKSSDRQGSEFGHQGKVLAGYQTVKRYFESHGRKIYNAGHGGKLDVFERVNYEDVIYQKDSIHTMQNK